MFKFVLRRVFSGLVLAVVVTSVVFVLLRVFGIDPARALLGDLATADQIQQKQQELGLDRSVGAQFVDWAGHALTGDLQTSWSTGQPVGDVLAGAFPITMTLALGTVLVALVLGVALGVVAAVRRGWLDTSLQLLVIIGFALPGFWLALVLVSNFAVKLGWFPATGWVPFSESPSGWLSSITLPIIALTVGSVAALAQQVRNSVIDVYRQDFVRTLRSRGLSPRRILLLHVLRNSSGPSLTVLTLQFIAAFGGAVIVERVFALRGIGTITQAASSAGDVPLVMGVVLLTTLIVVAVNLLLDLLLAALNPKVRLT